MKHPPVQYFPANRKITSHSDVPAFKYQKQNPIMNASPFHLGLLAATAMAASAFAQSGPAYEKAAGIRYPKIDFADVSLKDAAAFLSQASRDLTPDKNGINIILKTVSMEPKPVSLRLANIPAPEAIQYCAEAAGYSVRWTGNAAILSDDKTAPLPNVAFHAGGAGLAQRAAKTVLPRIAFKEASTREVLEFLAEKTRQPAPNETKLNIILNTAAAARPPAPTQAIPGLASTVKIAGLDEPPAVPPPTPVQGEELAARRLSFEMTGTTLPEVVRIVALLANATVRWDTHAVIVGPAGTETRPSVVNTVAIKGQVIMEKLSTIEIPKMDFQAATMSECANFLSRKLKELDTEGKGVNLLASGSAANAMLTLKLDSIPALEALRYMAELSGTDLRIEHNAIIFQPRN